MPVNVFLAYVDTYLGRQLLRQFHASPRLFTVYGCTWDDAAAAQLAAEEADTLARLAASRQELTASEANAADITDVSSIHAPAGEEEPGTPQQPTARVTPHMNADALSVSASEQPNAATHPEAAAGTLTVVGAAAHFFSRHDVAAVRAALVACEWFVVEMRQSQEVVDLLRAVQHGSLFDRPKTFVLLSSFMTWYATPSLTGAAHGHDSSEDGDAAAQQDVDAERQAADEGGSDDDDVSAPYPPPPEQPTAEQGADADEEAEGATAAAAADGELKDGEEEVLSEDQYNRRVPHVKYCNWRDAEKAVAAAHHAEGLPLNTFVVFAGLPYGEGESLLEPLFRLAWSSSTTKSATLPVYGTGKQCVPMIHVRDLATFTRKLLHRGSGRVTSAVPLPRYIFATDGANASWRAVVSSLNRSFGGQCELVEVPPAQYPLHTNVEHFTVDLRVERGAMAALMEEMAFDPAEGDVESLLGGADGEQTSSPPLWIADGGLHRHAEKTASEFRTARGVRPLRVVLQGPPLAGKTYLAQKLAAHYGLPCFSVEETARQYTQALADKTAALEKYQEQCHTSEQVRRTTIKKRRVLNAYRHGKSVMAGAGVDGNEDDDLAADDAHADAAGAVVDGAGAADPSEEPSAAAFTLTADELKEAREFVDERLQASARVLRWREEIDEMSRVLLMRVRVAAPGTALAGEDDGNSAAASGALKKRSVAAAASSAAAKSRKLTKEQQRKKEEEELQHAKVALRDAPFQDKALALMLRWRLSHADCRNQGYILDGFPRTVEQARLVFGSEPLAAPQTEEEALNPPPPSPRADDSRGEDEEDGAAGPDPLKGLSRELSDDNRLPDYVLVLKAPESFLLDRLAAVARLRQQEQAKAEDADEPKTPLAEPADDDPLQRFQQELRTFQVQFTEQPYTLLSYWECAVTVASTVEPGGRRVVSDVVAVQDTEPLVPPPKPRSSFAEETPGELELLVRDVVGPPHNFGPTPREAHQQEVRRAQLAQEQYEEERRCARLSLEANTAAYNQEREAREVVESRLLQEKLMDLAALEERKAPLREYLLESVVPLLSKGLVEVAAVRPENPLEYLSEWLLRHNPNSDVFMDL